MKKFVKTSLLFAALFSTPLVSCYKKASDNKQTEKAKAEVEVTGITLDQTTKSISAGEEFTLKATIAPEDATDKSVVWTSSNPDVATVDSNGKVTTISVGTVDIIAKSNNGKEAKCTVNVYGLEVRLAVGEGEEKYTDFDFRTFKNEVYEYKIHKKNGTVSDSWHIIDFALDEVNCKLIDNKTKMRLIFSVTEEGEVYKGIYDLNQKERIRDISEISPAEKVEASEPYFVRGIVSSSYYRFGDTGSTIKDPELLLKDVNTNDVYGVLGLNITQSSKLAGFSKGDELMILVNESAHAPDTLDDSGAVTTYNTNPTSGRKLLTAISANDVESVFKLSSGNNYNLDISQSTKIRTASQAVELFGTREKRVKNVYKLFTIPAGGKANAAKFTGTNGAK